LIASVIDAVLGTWIVVAAIIFVGGNLILAYRGIKRAVTHRDDQDQSKLNQIEEAAFYLRESGKQSTRGR